LEVAVLRILIATVKVPFIRGGAEVLAEGLQRALLAQGHAVDLIEIPYKWYPPERILEQMLACRLLDLTESEGKAVDKLIGLKFPAYLIPHPRKVLWILHQHRQAYDLWDHPTLSDMATLPEGALIRDSIHRADRELIPEASAVYTLSANVSERLMTYCGLASTPLYHPPPGAELFRCESEEDYFFYPSRLSASKRQHLVLEALAKTREPVRVVFASMSDHPAYSAELHSLSHDLKVDGRVEWMGAVSEEEKRRLYARSVGAIFIPVDEDYGYVTLEAMLSSKPVVTCTDSGTPREFVQNERTGLVTEPTPESLAQAMDALWRNRGTAQAWGAQGREHYMSLGISWSTVIERLLT
jgi:glycosyltransferase involved in cell wall biosynthesis